MRYAVLSDIHGNLEALTAVLDRVSGMRADRILCLGDLVGYNANPNECVAIARSENMVCVMGNHDSAACGLTEPDNFNPWAKQAVLWTRRELAPESRAYLRSLPRETALGGLFLCHGAIHDTDRYIMNLDDARETIDLLAELPGSPSLCFHGHTHVTMAFRGHEGAVIRERADDVLLEERVRYLINPGAVGQPRDGDPRAAFLVYDSGEERVLFHRTEYDITSCQDRIIRAGLPPRLAERLSLGW
jgi:predicted phosphodiesterase